MSRRFMALAAVLACASAAAAQGRIKEYGRAIVQYSSPEVKAVASYGYAQQNHDSAWLLIEFAVLAKERIAVHRNEFSLLTPDERRVPLATQQQFLEDHQVITRLLQNASVWRQPLTPYFTARVQPTIAFFRRPGGLVQDSAVTNLDEVATGDLFFKSPDGTAWKAGTYRLVLNHQQAKAELPIVLK